MTAMMLRSTGAGLLLVLLFSLGASAGEGKAPWSVYGDRYIPKPPAEAAPAN